MKTYQKLFQKTQSKAEHRATRNGFEPGNRGHGALDREYITSASWTRSENSRSDWDRDQIRSDQIRSDQIKMMIRSDQIRSDVHHHRAIIYSNNLNKIRIQYQRYTSSCCTNSQVETLTLDLKKKYVEKHISFKLYTHLCTILFLVSRPKL